MSDVYVYFNKVENGYTVKVGGQDGDCYIAATQDDCAKVVKTIIRGSFGEEKKSEPVRKKRKTRKKTAPVELPEAEVVFDPTEDAN